MNTTSVTIIMSSVRRFRAGFTSLALIAFASLGTAQSAHAGAPCQVNTQTAEVEGLLTAVHEFTSYNGVVF